MQNKINYSPEALQDLDDIGDYIAIELSNPQAALHILNNIIEDIALLANNPLMGANLSSITGIASDYRYLVVRKYLVFYRYSNGNIFVDRILYGRRNYLNILLGNA